MKKLALAALVAMPFVAGCYAEAYPAGYYARTTYVHPSHVRVYPARRVYVAPPPVVVAPPRVHVYW